MIRSSPHHPRLLAGLAVLLAVVSCKPPSEDHGKSVTRDEGELLRVGSVVVTLADLDYQLKEKHAGRVDEATRKQALDELTERARLSQAAHDAGLDDDPVARAEIARILATRLREKLLNPRLKAAAAPVPEERLRELYHAQEDRFQSPEKRQVAVLWLNPGADPERAKTYEAKLAQARDWYFSQSDLAKQPETGFSVLAVDYSEHAATRFKGGVLGWLARDGGSNAWTRAVAEIAFSLKDAGEVSEVVAGPEGVFLVRMMGIVPARKKSFDDVRTLLERDEQARLRKQVEDEFYQEVGRRYPVETR